MHDTERALQAAKDSLQSLAEQASLLALRADAAANKAQAAIDQAIADARESGAAATRERTRRERLPTGVKADPQAGPSGGLLTP